MLCIKCHSNMKKTVVRGILADVCQNQGCQGIWLDKGELDEIRANKIKGSDELWNEFDRQTKAEKGHRGTTIGLCPSCQKRGLQLVFVDGIALETCRDCGGMFFDKGELDEAAPKHNSLLTTLIRLFI